MDQIRKKVSDSEKRVADLKRSREAIERDINLLVQQNASGKKMDKIAKLSDDHLRISSEIDREERDLTAGYQSIELISS